MHLFILLIGIIVGYFLSRVINKISSAISDDKGNFDFLIILSTAILFLLTYSIHNLSLSFFKSTVLISMLIIISFVDLKHKIIPDKVVIVTLGLGLALIFIGEVSILSALVATLVGGGIMLLLAMVPNALGGGDIKMMFAVGIFLGVYKTVYAISLAFILAAIISTLLLLLKIKGRKDHIPFGPFLATGSLIAYLFV